MEPEPEPCQCPSFEEAVARSCNRALHTPITALEYDLCSGKCLIAKPPCGLAISKAYRRSWDQKAGKLPKREAKSRILSRPKLPVPTGPGTELKLLLESLGISTTGGGCGCEDHAAEMDKWGVDGCRQRREEIATWLRNEANKRSWVEKFQAACSALKTGQLVNPLDPYRGLVDEAIRRAEFKVNLAGVQGPKFEDNARLNLLYHVYPIKGNGTWQWNLENLKKRISLFNGKRMMAVVTDPHTNSFEDVVKALPDTRIEFIHMSNDPGLREVQTHEALFSRLRENNSDQDLTLYAHAKGVSRGGPDDKPMVYRGIEVLWTRSPGACLWADFLYRTHMDQADRARKLLAQYPVVGAFKRVGPFPSSKAQWHYAGGWAWFRNRDLFSRSWQNIERFVFGMEAYWGNLFLASETGDLFGASLGGDLYNRSYLEAEVESAYKQWLSE